MAVIISRIVGWVLISLFACKSRKKCGIIIWGSTLQIAVCLRVQNVLLLV